jgi:hypothetical protein
MAYRFLAVPADTFFKRKHEIGSCLRYVKHPSQSHAASRKREVGTLERLFVHGHCKSFRPDVGLSWHHQLIV